MQLLKSWRATKLYRGLPWVFRNCLPLFSWNFNMRETYWKSLPYITWLHVCNIFSELSYVDFISREKLYPYWHENDQELYLLEEALFKVDSADPTVISSIINEFSQFPSLKENSFFQRYVNFTFSFSFLLLIGYVVIEFDCFLPTAICTYCSFSVLSNDLW